MSEEWIGHEHVAGLELAVCDLIAHEVMFRPTGLKTASREEQKAAYETVLLIRDGLVQLLKRAIDAPGPEPGVSLPPMREWRGDEGAMTNDHGYPPMTAEERALFSRVGTPKATQDDLIAAAKYEADHALRSLPPHCLPTKDGLPHNPDHANACAHRCWSFLLELTDIRAKAKIEHEDRFLRTFTQDK